MPLEHLAIGRVEAPQVAHGVDVLGCHAPSVAAPGRETDPERRGDAIHQPIGGG